MLLEDGRPLSPVVSSMVNWPFGDLTLVDLTKAAWPKPKVAAIITEHEIILIEKGIGKTESKKYSLQGVSIHHPI
jgi:hypothetical protein